MESLKLDTLNSDNFEQLNSNELKEIQGGRTYYVWVNNSLVALELPE